MPYNQVMSAPTTAEVRAHWDQFASNFSGAFERTTLQLAQTLATQLRLHEGARLLEVGGGTGAAAKLVSQLAPELPLVTTDLSGAMSRLANAQTPARVQVSMADAERLPFAAGAFDRYLANLSLMLVPDAEACLREAARVVRPGGLLAWSVWGRPEHSPMFSLPPQSAKRVGITLPEKPRSNFHLGDRRALIERLQRHGFTRVRAWYQPMALPLATGQEFVTMIFASPRWQALLEELGPERTATLQAALSEDADAILAEGHPLGLEGLVALAER